MKRKMVLLVPAIWFRGSGSVNQTRLGSYSGRGCLNKTPQIACGADGFRLGHFCHFTEERSRCLLFLFFLSRYDLSITTPAKMIAHLAWGALTLSCATMVAAQSTLYTFTMGVTNPAPVPGKPFTITWTGGESNEAVYIVLNFYAPEPTNQNIIEEGTDILCKAISSPSFPMALTNTPSKCSQQRFLDLERPTGHHSSAALPQHRLQPRPALRHNRNLHHPLLRNLIRIPRSRNNQHSIPNLQRLRPASITRLHLYWLPTSLHYYG